VIHEHLEIINEEFYADRIEPAKLDLLLADAWRHFGTHFFRYNIGFLEREIRLVIPLRIRLSEFLPSKSQRRILRENSDLYVVCEPLDVDDAAEQLFNRHKQRFAHNVPTSILNFVSPNAGASPCDTKQICIYKDNELIAASYFDVGYGSTSGIYAMFEPSAAARSLGIFTMLKEIEFSIETGKDFYYQGYAYEGESFYDYKKRFRGSEAFDWHGTWLPF